MLKGFVFSKQLFENPIFALFINTFLNGVNGVSNNYLNGMQPTASGSTVTINSGAVCIQGRFLGEDSSTTISAGTNNAYCKLVIEIDLDQINTEDDFQQGAYKIITSATGYPNLTQTNIVKNVSGIYQYELARFRTSSSGISEFQDMRTFLDFTSIYNQITEEYQAILQQLQDELSSVEDGSAYVLKNDFAIITGTMTLNANSDENLGKEPVKVTMTSKEIDFPVGFNKDNCIPISTCFARGDRAFSEGWNNYPDSADSLSVTLPYRLTIGSTDDIPKLILVLGNMGQSQSTVNYKIVLMKIGE